MRSLRGKIAKRGLRDLRALDALETVPVLTPRSLQSPLASWSARRSFGDAEGARTSEATKITKIVECSEDEKSVNENSGKEDNREGCERNQKD